MNKVGVKVTFDFEKVILTNDCEFVGKGILYLGFSMLYLVAVNKINVSISLIAKSISLWYARLPHVNIASIKGLK